MSSTGKYDGTLDTINVEGDTEMPDFALGIAGNPMRLTTHYIAVVDGTNGDTHLKSVEARLGNSPLSVSGDIIGTPGIKGKHIVLDATSQNARAEDLIGLAVERRISHEWVHPSARQDRFAPRPGQERGRSFGAGRPVWHRQHAVHKFRRAGQTGLP